MQNEKWVWLDMDGTFADLYSVKGWLTDLESFSTRPYEKAQSIYNDVELLDVLLQLKAKGYNIGVISWSSKAKNVNFDRKVKNAKINWLKKRGYDLVLDKIIITQYGVSKADTCRPYGTGYLVDDEEPNRNAWNLGGTINANKNIVKALAKLL